MLKNKQFLQVAMLLGISVLNFSAIAQNAGTEDELTKEILRMDSLMFSAFNNQDLEMMKKIFDKDLEFYHDITGLTHYDQNIAATKNNFEANLNLHRELLPGSTEVYPVKDFGAMQIGKHRFCHPENGKQDCGTFGFVHIWKKTSEGWKITRVISYGH